MKQRKIIITALIVLLIFSCLFLFRIIQKKEKFQPLFGKVVEAVSRNPIAGLDIIVDSLQTKTNANGEFHFEKVSKNGKILIKGPGVFKETIIPVANRKYLEIAIDNSLFNLFIYLEKYEQDRQYRKIYQIFHPDIKAIYPEERYLAEKNAWRDKKEKEGLKVLKPEFQTEIKILDNWKSDFTKKNYQNATEIVLIKNFEIIETKEIKQEKEKNYFINENGNWRWLYEPT